MNLAMREIPLGGHHVLKLDYADGLYRAAYYWTGPDKSQKRVAGSNRQLREVLTIVFGDAAGEPGARDHDPATVEHYIRSTSWGRELP